MSGQRGSPNDPTSRRGLLSLALEPKSVLPEIQKMLENLFDERDAGILAMRYGLMDGQPKTLYEVGIAYGVTRERVQVIIRRCLAHLQQLVAESPLVMDGEQIVFDLRQLVVTDGGQVVGFVDVRRSGASPSSTGPEGDLVWCPQCQQRQFLPESGGFYGGRHRKYCSNACRQAAYRDRRRANG